MNNKIDAKQLDKQYILQTYGRHDLCVERGKGAKIYSDDSREYIDFASGIGTLSLGTANDGYIEAVTSQLKKVQHISNYFYSQPTGEVAQKLVELSGLKRAFFANSGAEANEGAIKVARKYSYDKYGKDRTTIVTLSNSFHGRTVTTLSATGQDKFHDFFFPFTEGFKYSPINDIGKLKENLSDDVCAVMFELVQGEGGVNIMTHDFAKELSDICSERDILLIADEVQTGIARTGKMFCYEHYGILPDVVTLAKGLGGGLPIGVFLCGGKTENVLSAGQHGTTFGGNPVCSAAARHVLSVVANNDFLNEVTQKGNYIRQKIAAFNNPHILNIRGVGLMIGIQTDLSIKDISNKAFNNGLLVLTAGSDVIRLLPPLTINYDEIDSGLKMLENSFKL